MYENEKSLLKKLCLKSNYARQMALENELKLRGVRYENWGSMALVCPAATNSNKVISLVAHFDAVPNSYGYNDNGMALVTLLDHLIYKVPNNVEIVFTNVEEQGALGAKFYLENTQKQISNCINLDVVGCFDKVYLDTMNSPIAKKLTNCKQGFMPYSDAHAFADRGIQSVCFSSGPSDCSFQQGIYQICSTLHNNRNDNNFNILNFEMIQKVSNEVKNIISLINAA